MPSPDITHEFDTIEDTITAFKNGEFIIVLDSASRENEGDLIIAASDMTSEKMAFMVRHTSGIICTPSPAPYARTSNSPNGRLERRPQPHRLHRQHRCQPPSTTTGISAHDRALACRTLADPEAGPESLRRPGHVFPLRAREGGVRERPGHTEAAEFCSFAAGKPPVGVICEIVEDGEEVAGEAIRKEPGMLRRDGCLAFGKKWGVEARTVLMWRMEDGRWRWMDEGVRGTRERQTNGEDKTEMRVY
ncbi:hypothetical protein DID88_007269 [Monilinia fructigena]|uniref:3,4-dihydroxy-2-butanone-4-phosphate synthase n=1 Tax=Monilinia fructigena TaxID=38457 RepID=A0A395JA72_9HELO|nr:hypothetical protein DID88_007269 [Monilinia fructigena]